jgi:hypothetical protein
MAKATQVTAEVQEQARPKVKMVRNPMPIDELFVDGVSGLITRAGIAKIDLFRVVGYDPETKAERRQVSHRLVMPLAAVPDLLRLFQQAARAVQEAAGRAPQASAPEGGNGQGPATPPPESDPMV